MTENLFIGLKIMGQGMLGIFVSILLIMIVISIIGKLNSNKRDDSEA